MSHNTHIFRVKANSQDEAVKRVDKYLNGYNDSNIWHTIISAFNQAGDYTQIYNGVTFGYPKTSEELDNYINSKLFQGKPDFNRLKDTEVNIGYIDEMGITNLKTRCRKDAEIFFIIVNMHI